MLSIVSLKCRSLPSKSINSINTNDNKKIANDTQSVTDDGIHIIEELNNKSKATSKLHRMLSENTGIREAVKEN